MGSWLDRLFGKKTKDAPRKPKPTDHSQLGKLQTEFGAFLTDNLAKASFRTSSGKPSVVTYLMDMAKDWNDEKRTRYLVYLLCVAREFKEHQRQELRAISYLVQYLEKKQIAWTAEQIELFLANRDFKNIYPIEASAGILGTLKAYLKSYSEKPIPAELKSALQQLHKKLYLTDEFYCPPSRQKRCKQLTEILTMNDEHADHFATLPDDRLGKKIKQDLIEKEPIKNHGPWAAYLRHLNTASGGKPSAKWNQQAKTLQPIKSQASIGACLSNWLSFATSLEFLEEERSYRAGSFDATDTYTIYTYLSDHGINLLKGMAWAWPIKKGDSSAIQVLTKVAERGYEKIPHTGTIASRVANACLYKLSEVPGLEGVAQLSRLGLKIKHATARKTINKYLTAAAEREGVSVLEIEEMSVDHHGLTAGVLVEQFDDYRAELSIEKPGRSTLAWYRPDGKPQKSVPNAVKTGFAERLKQLRNTKKLLDKTTSAQRDRIDRLLRIDNRWPRTAFAKTYEQHGVLSWFAQRLIWQVRKEADDSLLATIIGDGEGGWILLSGQSYTLPTDVKLSLWHPALAEATEVTAWRKTMDKRELQQPIKQAYREIYLLTPAELNTEIYSNRMAGHLLRQHQYANLARLRGWRATLLGCWDSPDDDIASLILPHADLEVQFYVQSAQADNAYNDAGIWNYITTDQVRFVRNNQPLNLAEVPALIFSEVMRDCDLFVGVASVGNDPEWQDRGETPIVNQYGGYWREYSFGKLQEVAKSRKAILERLVPRLKIRDIAQVKGNFLEVQGHLHTYKIHIGSGNILMEPNDQYLCIVPGRGKVKTGLEKSFIPFEGDRTLSVIISKALLLADDQSIDDPTITRQL